MKLVFCRWDDLRLKICIVLAVLAVGVIFTVNQIIHCDIGAQKRLVQTPGGNVIPKVDIDMKFIKFGDLSKICDYVNEKIECVDVRKSGESMLRQAQLAIIRVLRIIALICEKHNIKYWLLSGTLLGAYRDGSFIPWDNDADIGIMYEDYLKLITAFKSDLPSDLYLQNGSDEPSYLKSKHVEAKVRDRNSCYCHCIRKGCQFHDGLQVDIFVFKSQSQNKKNIISVPEGRFNLDMDDIFPPTKIEFEGMSFLAPKNTEAVLSTLFGGNFMTPAQNRCPENGFAAIPWYSCSFIESLSPAKRNAVIKESMVHDSYFYWYFG